MMNLLKYVCLIIGAIVILTIVAPIVIVVLLGGGLAYVGMKMLVSSESLWTKLASGGVIVLGIAILIGGIPFLPIIALAIGGYILYKWYEEKGTSKTNVKTYTVNDSKPSFSAFEKFEKEWTNLTKGSGK
jgi:hypothetical protein